MKNISCSIIFLSVCNFLSTICFAQTKIGAGGYHSLAICINDIVWDWGRGSFGQLGIGSYYSSNIPVSLSTPTGFIAVTGGEEHSLALNSDSTVWAWGWNGNGQLGNGVFGYSSSIPLQVSSLTGIIAIAGGVEHSLALKNDGTVWAWGNNSKGELGNGTNINSNIPVKVSSITGIIAIAGGAGGYHSLALKNDGTVWVWGFNYKGQLGNGTNIDSNVPVLLSSLSSIKAIAAGFCHSLALKNDGTVWAWGDNSKGELGNGSNIDTNVPIQIISLSDITAIAGGNGFSLALKKDGTVLSWGWNYYHGQLGNGTNIDTNLPGPVSIISGVSDIATGYWHSLALTKDGRIWAWGYNGYGCLGIGTNTDSNIPIEVTGLCQVATEVYEITEPLSVSIFPNPSVGIFTLSFKNKTVEAKICIYDVLGNCVLNKLSVKNSNQEIDLSNQSKGIYFLEIVSDEEKVVKKIILN